MHLPSNRIYREMVSEPASHWFVSATGDPPHAILLKAPSTCLKSLVKDCQVEFIFGIIDSGGDRILATAAKLIDDPESPLLLSGIQRHAEEHTALKTILDNGSTLLFLFGELSYSVAWAECVFEPLETSDAVNIIGSIDNLYVGPFDATVSSALDRFDKTLDPTRTDLPDVSPVKVVHLCAKLSKFKTTETTVLGVPEYHTHNLGDSDEGGNLEASVWQALQGCFEGSSFRNPTVHRSKSSRELTDILCFGSTGILLIESKVTSVISTETGRSMSRKVSTLQKRVDKAIGQLDGAIRSLMDGNPVVSAQGDAIEFDRNLPVHGIAVVSELWQFGDWSQQVQKMISVSRRREAMIHLLDLRELVNLVTASQTPEVLMLNFTMRFRHFLKEETVFIRGKIPDSK